MAISEILCLLLGLYQWALFAAVILSFVVAFRPDWRPPEGVRPLIDLIHSVTDPPVFFLRRYIQPVPSIPIDLAFLAWVLIVMFVRRAICSAGF